MRSRSHASHLIVTPDRIEPWHGGELTESDFGLLVELQPELVLLGTGARQRFPQPGSLRPLVSRRIGCEVMDTPAACRTYNILAAEGRRVVAALRNESQMTVAVDSRVPDFSASATGGEFRLTDQRGKTLVLYFYPKDNTPGCTTEGADFARSHPKLVKAGAVVAGVSRDSLKSHEGFKAKMKFRRVASSCGVCTRPHSTWR